MPRAGAVNIRLPHEGKTTTQQQLLPAELAENANTLAEGQWCAYKVQEILRDITRNRQFITVWTAKTDSEILCMKIINKEAKNEYLLLYIVRNMNSDVLNALT